MKRARERVLAGAVQDVATAFAVLNGSRLLRVALTLAVSLAGETAQSDEGVAEKAAMGEYLLHGIASHREQLRQGQYRYMEIRRTHVGTEEAPPYVSIVFCAFDRDAGLLRCDRESNLRLLSTEVVTLEQFKERAGRNEEGAGVAAVEYIRYFKTPNKSARWRWLRAGKFGPDVVRVHGPDMAPPPRLKVVGLDGVGLYSLFEYNRADGADFASSMALLLDGTIEEVSKIGEVWRLTVVNRNGKRRSTLRVNEAHGFAVERFEAQYLGKDGTWEPNSYVSETEWVPQSGAWVPRFALARSFSEARGGKPYGWTVSSLELSFEWESINTRPEPRYFTADGLARISHLPP